MNFPDNWARVFDVITFLTFGEAQIIGGIVPNLIAFGLFLGAIGYFALTGRTRNKAITSELILKRDP